MIIVIMGVSGSGKSTIGSLLAQELECQFLDADDFHPDTNKDKMRSGTPLTDADREPWLIALNSELRARDQGKRTAVLACSALKRSYRDTLRSGIASIVFVHLSVQPGDAAERMRNRRDHFMPPDLIASQFGALEAPEQKEAIVIDASADPDQIVEAIMEELSSRLPG